MLESVKGTIKKQLERSMKLAKTKDPNISEIGKTTYRELAFRLMLLNKAEEYQKEALRHVSKHDAQAYRICVQFYKNATNADGPGVHKTSFRDSIRENDKKNMEEIRKLIPAFSSVTPQIVEADDLYEKKIVGLMNCICEYVIYHREQYVPTKTIKQSVI